MIDDESLEEYNKKRDAYRATRKSGFDYPPDPEAIRIAEEKELEKQKLLQQDAIKQQGQYSHLPPPPMHMQMQQQQQQQGGVVPGTGTTPTTTVNQMGMPNLLNRPFPIPPPPGPIPSFVTPGSTIAPGKPNIPPPMPGMAGHPQSNPNNVAQQQQQQFTKHARRIYIGGIPDTATSESIKSFFSTALMAVNGTTENLEGDPVLNVYVNMDKKFAFAEYRTGMHRGNF